MTRRITTVAVLAALAIPGTAHAERPATQFGAHALVWTQAHREVMFREAARLGVSHIRIAHFMGEPTDSLDQNLELARLYGLRPLVVLVGVEAEALPELVASRPGVEWQIENEPDGGKFYSGTAEDYRQLLTDSRAVAPVVNGGLMTRNPDWLPPEDVGATAHVRPSTPARASWVMARWSDYYGQSFQITEFDYSADPAYARSPQYVGEDGQARFYRRTLPRLLGAERVYITLRDLGGMAAPQFHSTGVLANSNIDNGRINIRRRPSFHVVAQLIRSRYPFIGRTRLRAQRHGREVTAQLRGDDGCKYGRRVVVRHKTHRGWHKLKTTRTRPGISLRTTKRKIRLIVLKDGVCKRSTTKTLRP